MSQKDEVLYTLHKQMLIWSVVGLIAGLIPWPDMGIHLHAAMPLIVLILGMRFSIAPKNLEDLGIPPQLKQPLKNLSGYAGMTFCAAVVSIVVPINNPESNQPILFLMVAFCIYYTASRYLLVKQTLKDNS
jgi:hypothetical protein